MLQHHFASCHSVAVSQLHSVTVGHLDEISRSRSARPGASQDIRPGDIVVLVPVSCSASCSQVGPAATISGRGVDRLGPAGLLIRSEHG